MIDYTGDIAFTLDAVTEQEATGRMAVAPGMLNPFGTVHAGALTWFADVVATHFVLQGATASEGMADFPVATSLNVQLLGNVTGGEIHATARWVKRGRRISTVRTELRSDAGKLLFELTSSHVAAKG
ncbi:PaaI family thioesterase [Rhodovulum sp. DZ06]|uniref:PaaI family thioesterase n=1 Tax=Rhodovulum sp. DZ06 TaxID=3425126 RepID=UPI003D34A1ED